MLSRFLLFLPAVSIACAKTKTFAMPYVICASWGWRDRCRSFAAQISAEFRGRIFFFANAPPRTRRSSVITQGPKGNSRTSRNVWPVPEAGSDSSSKFYRIIALINEHGQGSEIEAHTMYFLLPLSFVFTCNFRVLRQASI